MQTRKTRITYAEMVKTLPNLETEEQINLLEALYSVLKKSLIKKKKEHSLL